MRALQIEEYGTPPRLTQIAPPEPGRSEVLVRIAACGLNFADLLMMRGEYQERPPLPLTLGMELAGTVEAVGPDTTGPAPGTRVAVFAGQGGLAERGCFAAERCLPLPDAMPAEHAAAFQIAYGTSHVALDHRARLAPGERLVVLGAAGGVGLTAVEIGKLMGAEVIAVARGADKLAAARAAGADHLIDGADTDLRAALKELGGVDVVYDPVGGAQGEAALAALRPGGRMVIIGFASGEMPRIAPNRLLVKNISVLGLYWGGYLALAPEVLRDSLARLLDWYEQRRLAPHIGHVLPLERAAEGLELLRTRRATGKIVIRMDNASTAQGKA